MAGPAEILRELHRLRRHAKDLQAEIERLPRMLRAQQARVVRQEETLAQAHEAVKKLKVAIRDNENKLKAMHQQIDKHKKQLNEATAKKEYEALQHEIAQDKQNCSQLEDQILEDMAAVEEQTAQLPELEKVLKQAREEVANFDRTSQERQVNLTGQLQEAHNQIQTVEASLPGDVKQHYDRLVAARGEDALSAVSGRTCAACYTEITAQNYNELTLGRLVYCKACGRMLYVPG